jgi:tetratricopeptide (TPR) repeat protein
MMHTHKSSPIFILPVLLIMLVILKSNTMIVHRLINRDALLSSHRKSQSNCSWTFDREIKFGQRALDANMTALAASYLDRLLHMSGQFPCSSISSHRENKLPTDARWGRFIVSDIELMGDEISIWLSMWAWANRWRLVKDVALATVEQYPDQLFGYYYLAQAQLHGENNTQAALDTYLSVVELFPDSALLCREIARLYHHRLGDTSKALHWYQVSLELDAGDPTVLLGIGRLAGDGSQGLTNDQIRQLGTPEPKYEITKWTEGIFASGYTLDEDLYVLSHGVDVELYEFWDSSRQDVQPLPGWFQMGKWWVARVRTLNLAPNPRFVWDQRTDEAMMPQGYLDLSTGVVLADHAVVRDQRGGQTVTCAQLLNKAREKTGFFSLPISVGPTCYLQTGWVKTSDDGNAYIGYQWLGDTVEQPDYDYVASQVQTLDWTHHAGVAVPLSGVQSVRLRLLNNLSNGTVCLDDIMFVPVPCR